ncbi:copper chaperone PCu(A)C [Accumulibacter sp.]|uniref:copper chaperone PCu(A)C n=1 Tax=Accumulibacter sp. TaxID=2053492 RepID=UPI002638DD4A|nr:copper chaperone PCu(A)C [Accumulibacter sp.]
MRLHPALIALAATLVLPRAALANDSDLQLLAPYVRLAPPGTANTAAFMIVSNTGRSDRKLLKADSPVARRVELHSHVNDQGVMRMRQVTEIVIKAGGQSELKPGGYHVMLLDLRQPLKEGESVPLTLSFDDGFSKQIDAPVRRPQTVMATDPAAQHGSMPH